MRSSQAEKMETIRLVEESDLSVTRTLNELDVARSIVPQSFEMITIRCYVWSVHDESGQVLFIW